MNIAPTTYYDGEMPVVTTTNLEKMNKMRRTAREMTEAQRASNRAPTENLVAVQKRGVGLAQGGIEFLRLQEQNTKEAQQWFAASMKVAQLQQRSVRFAQEWLHHGAEALREQTEEVLRQTEEATREADLRARVIGALGLDDYDGLNLAEVTEKLDDLSVEELERLRELEKRTEDRESLVKRIDRKIRTNSQGKTLP
jgi:hypothetical protein